MFIFVMAALFYQFYAIPVGLVFVFFFTRRLLRYRSSAAAAGIALVWAMVIFTPLLTQSQSFFSEFYSPWYLGLLISPPTPQFSLGALAITIAVSLTSSVVAIIVARGWGKAPSR